MVRPVGSISRKGSKRRRGRHYAFRRELASGGAKVACRTARVIHASVRRVKGPMQRPLRPAATVAASVLAFLLVCCGSDTPPLLLAPGIDLSRYAGRWYVISTIPSFATSGNVGSTVDVSFPSDEALTEVYRAHLGTFGTRPISFTMNGYVVAGTGNARWRESLLWPLYSSYLILYVDPNYRTALVGHPGRRDGWVLARTKVIDRSLYQSLLGRLKDQGYDTGRFRRVPQTTGQIGDTGFQ
jgi:apolipoprotein D and lipocalin family protein